MGLKTAFSEERGKSFSCQSISLTKKALVEDSFGPSTTGLWAKNWSNES